MNRNDFLVALFGHPVWFHCKQCHRVMAGGTESLSRHVAGGSGGHGSLACEA